MTSAVAARPRRFLAAALTAAFLLTACSGPTGRAAGAAPSATSPTSSTTAGGPTSGPPSVAATPPARRRNIVLVLTDDLSANLLPYMPNVQALARAGTSFSNYTTTNPLCCPARASILTGKFPHNTGIYSNDAPEGGFEAFRGRGLERSTFATDLRAAGYRTAMMGKYLNEYAPGPAGDGTDPYVPPGWTDWVVAGNAYGQFGYRLAENGEVTRYGDDPEDYLTDVLSARASAFVAAAAEQEAPFLLEVSTFSPHGPYTPAPRDAQRFRRLKAPRGPAFDTLPADAPAWLADRPPLTPRQVRAIDVDFRERARSVQAVDRMVGSLRTTLTRAGVADDTVVLFTSDNGYHMGEYRLPPGKRTPFDTDVRVPLIVAGAGVAAGRTVSAPVQGTDLRPTFDELAGAPVPPDVDGHSLVGLLDRDRDPAGAWRGASLIEYLARPSRGTDPDRPGARGADPPTYRALRTATETYVEYADGTREHYDRRTDPHQLRNTASRLTPQRRAELQRILVDLTTCRGQRSCWAAGGGPAGAR